MFATPVVYPVSKIPARWQWLLYANPMAPVVESFRAVSLGTGAVPMGALLSGTVITAIILGVGIALFSRVEQSFADTV
jgi:lipopolysaccharide transport system permease protein